MLTVPDWTEAERGDGIGVRRIDTLNFHREARSMNNISTGFGLCVLGLGVALWPIMDRFAPSATQAHAGVPIAVISAAAMGQAGPTIVWYQATEPRRLAQPKNEENWVFDLQYIYRAWSDGTLEYRTIKRKVEDLVQSGNGGWWPVATHYCEDAGDCRSPWITISSPNEGFKAFADVNSDESVDGADLALVLDKWGDAPRHDIPPSDCPLNLINP